MLTQPCASLYMRMIAAWFSGCDAYDLVLKCNQLLVKLQSRSQSNSIKINPVKSKAILFRPRNIFQLKHLLQFSGTEIELVNEHKILGVYFSRHLNWDFLVNRLRSKLSAAAGMLSACHTIMPTKTKIQ